MTVNAADNGRNQNGRFAPGNRCGKGNPSLRRAAELRSAMMAAVTDDDVKAVVAKLVELSKAGDTTAIKLLFDRCLGRVTSLDEPIDQTDISSAADNLGPVTPGNLEEHKRRLLEELEDGTFDIEHERAIRMARHVTAGVTMSRFRTCKVSAGPIAGRPE